MCDEAIINNDKIISQTIVFHIFFMACKNMLVSNSTLLFSLNTQLNRYSAIIIAIVYLRLIILCKMRLQIPTATMVLLACCAAFCCITAVFDLARFISNTSNYQYVRIQATTFIIYCLPLFFCVSLLSDFDILIDLMFSNAPVLFVFTTIAFGFKLIDNKDAYSMSYGYNALWCYAIYCFKFRDTKKLLHLLIAIATALFILVAGSRGPILCISAVVILLIFETLDSKRSMQYAFIVAVFAIFVFINFTTILDLLISVLNRLNISSRTIQVLKNGNIAYTGDRAKYYENLIAALNESPIIGLGAFGGEATVGLAHSLYLDIFANFGYLFGSLYLIFLIYRIAFIYKNYKLQSICKFLGILACLSFPIGFIDSEFWVSKELWMIMGLFIAEREIRSRSSLTVYIS